MKIFGINVKTLFTGWLLFSGNFLRSIASPFPREEGFAEQEKWITDHPNAATLQLTKLYDTREAFQIPPFFGPNWKYNATFQALPSACQLIVGDRGFQNNFYHAKASESSSEPNTVAFAFDQFTRYFFGTRMPTASHYRIMGMVNFTFYIPQENYPSGIKPGFAWVSTSLVTMRLNKATQMPENAEINFHRETNITSSWNNAKQDEMVYVIEGHTSEGSCYVSGRTTPAEARSQRWMLEMGWGFPVPPSKFKIAYESYEAEQRRENNEASNRPRI